MTMENVNIPSPNGDVNFSVKLKYDDAPIEKYPYELKLKITDSRKFQ